MVPLVKGYSTETSLEVTSLGVQVHGGMGFIEETGAAQYYRDAKILTIYEGTTAIQANDLVGRKTARVMAARWPGGIAAQIEKTEADLLASGTPAARWPWPTPHGRAQGAAGCDRLRGRWHQGPAQRCVCWQRALPDAGGQCGGGLATGAQPAGGARTCCKGTGRSLHARKITTAQFYADHILVKARPARQHCGRRSQRDRAGAGSLLTAGAYPLGSETRPVQGAGLLL